MFYKIVLYFKTCPDNGKYEIVYFAFMRVII